MSNSARWYRRTLTMLAAFVNLLYGQAIIIDHTCANISSIPLSAINNAKAGLHIAYGHSSHGQQLIEGTERLDAYMTGKGVPAGTYAVTNNGTTNPAVLDFRDWPWRTLGWQQYARDLGTRTDDNNASFYISYTAWMLTTRKYLGWTPASGDGSNLDHYATGTPNFNPANFNNRQVVIVWAWCGQASYNGDQIVNDYLASMSQLVQDYPQVRFVYMTGHLDGTALSNYLHQHNAMIRSYCQQNNRILYDFADIESYDPDGNYYGNKYVSDACNYDYNGNNVVEESAEIGGAPKQPQNGDRNWALDWQEAHPGEWYTCDINNYHTQHLNDNLKAYAFWWLCARLAGWDGGSGSTVAAPAISPNGGTFEEHVQVSLSTMTSGASIRYTTSGSDPDTGSSLYAGPFLQTASATIKARAYKTSLTPSSITSAIFTITKDTIKPTILQAYASGSASVMAVFSEDVDSASAVASSNYQIDRGIGIGSVALQADKHSVLLAVSPPLTNSTTYSITVNNVKDLRNNAIRPNSQATFSYSTCAGEWPFNEGTGDTVRDATGNGSNGVRKTAAWTTGLSGAGLSFDGNDTVDVGLADFSMDSTNEFSVSLWFNASSLGGTLIQRGQYFYPFMLGISGSNLRMCLRSSVNTNYLNGAHAVTTGSWHHAVCTFNTEDSLGTIYLDGAADNSGTANGRALGLMDGNRTWIGAGFNGLIDEVKIYNRALSAAEVLALYQEGITAGTAPPVLASPANASIDVSRTPSLIWHKASNDSLYSLKLSASSNFDVCIINENRITDTAMAVPAALLAGGTQYYWKAAITKKGGNVTNFCTAWSFTTVPQAPGQPGLVSPLGDAANVALSPVLNWAAVTGAARYRLQVSSDGTFATNVVVDDTMLTATSRAVGPLSTSTTYYWRVNARNAGGTGAWSETRSFATQPPAAGVPTLSSPANSATNQALNLSLAWNSVSGASTYRVQLSTTSNFSGNVIVDDSTITTTSKPVGPLSNGTTYYWRVNATNPGGTSAWSAVCSLTTMPALPSAVSLLRPAGGDTVKTDSMLLVWTKASPIVTKYRLDIASDSQFVNATIDSSITDSIKIIRNLSNNTTCWWRVRACNPAGWGPWSATGRCVVAKLTTPVIPREYGLAFSGMRAAGGVIKYGLPKLSRVSMRVYDLHGRMLFSMVEQVQPAGIYSIRLSGASCTNGYQILTFKAGDYRVQRKFVVIR